jgi:hypothetical protein
VFKKSFSVRAIISPFRRAHTDRIRISGILLLLGVRKSIMRIIQTVSTIGATVLFVIIMIVTADSNARYA